MGGTLDIHAGAALSKVLSEALRIAQAKRHSCVTSMHALQALSLSDPGKTLLSQAGVIIPKLQPLFEQEYLKLFPTKSPVGNISLDREYQALLQQLDNKALFDGGSCIELVDLFGALRAPDLGTGRVLRLAGAPTPPYATLDGFLSGTPAKKSPTQALVKKGSPPISALDAASESGDEALDPKLILAKYSSDMTAAARNGCFDPAVARDREIDDLIDVLQRRTKNNPLLVGEAGVGKTAIVEGLAQRIVAGQVPPGMRSSRLLSLDLVSMLAGARYRGDFEERLQGALRAVENDGDIILFVDEVHMLVGAGGGDGAMNAGNIIKPLLARGQLRMIGATTFQESKLIEKDAALARRFQIVVVPEPTAEQAILMLVALVPRYAQHHGVVIHPDAVSAAVHLSKRYIAERKLPDKALDVLDHAAARLHAGRPDDYARLLTLRDRHLQDSLSRSQRDQISLEITELELSLPVVNVGSVANVISLRTGIPVESLSMAERTKLKNLEPALTHWVCGQEQAVSAVSDAIRRNRTGLSDANKPWGSFLFLGPTGVGKTALSTALAATLFNDPESLIRLNMSEYSERSSVTRLIGSAPGYSGHDAGGTLTEALRRRPYAVLLFDEIEKASPEVLSLLLQLLDDGGLTDGQGRVVDASNTVVVMTTKLGSSELLAASTDSAGEQSAFAAAAKILPADLYDRIDEVLVFKRLSHQVATKILDRLLSDLSSKLTAQNVTMVVSDGARLLLIELGFDPQEGARPLKRALQKHVENAIANCLLDIQPGKPYALKVDVEGGTCKVKMQSSSRAKAAA
jgi:ATP-dependent Clp protease ATP-binding subunit ClpC